MRYTPTFLRDILCDLLVCYAIYAMLICVIYAMQYTARYAMQFMLCDLRYAIYAMQFMLCESHLW